MTGHNNPAFDFYIGIDYAGAQTPLSGLRGLRVYLAARDAVPVEILPPPGAGKYWSRRGVAEWLAARLAGDSRVLAGLDHGFSFPKRYFDAHAIPYHWPTFLDDFHRHWPTDQDTVSVEDVRRGRAGHGAARGGEATWRRPAEIRARAKSVFHFDVPGSVAKSSHAGIPWLRFLRQKLADRVHFWPFDGWEIAAGTSAVTEVYPSLWHRDFPHQNRTPDQHDAWTIAAWLQRADRDGTLQAFLNPTLPLTERSQAAYEGWILGMGRLVPGRIVSLGTAHLPYPNNREPDFLPA